MALAAATHPDVDPLALSSPCVERYSATTICALRNPPYFSLRWLELRFPRGQGHYGFNPMQVTVSIVNSATGVTHDQEAREIRYS